MHSLTITVQLSRTAHFLLCKKGNYQLIWGANKKGCLYYVKRLLPIGFEIVGIRLLAEIITPKKWRKKTTSR